MIIDAWAQHPTLRHMQDPIFEPLRRWTGAPANSTELPVKTTVATMDQAGVDKSLICAWVAPRNVMISNDEVAGFVAQAPDRLVGVGSVDISRPMAAVRVHAEITAVPIAESSQPDVHAICHRATR